MFKRVFLAFFTTTTLQLCLLSLSYGQEAAEAAAASQPTQNRAERGERPRRPPSEQAESSVTAKEKTDQPTAAASDPSLIYTVVPEGDANYDLLGEFVGDIKSADSEPSVLALQIRPIGNDGFEARQYHGGLPGQEGCKVGESIQLIGRRATDTLVLSGGPWAIFVSKDQCTLIDREGTRIGELKRVERSSPSLGAKPPEGALVLFDGSNTDHFTQASLTDEGLLKAGATLKPMFQDFDMHVEFRLPYMPEMEGQSRGNSGCYLQSRYEVQVLDSFSELPTFNGCSSLYRQKAADLNMCLPPLRWQTYDIRFTAPRWGSDGSKLSNARITVWQNGVKTQNDAEIVSKTGAGKAEEPNLLPILFQDHKDPVRFRNIWVIDRGLSGSNSFPPLP